MYALGERPPKLRKLREGDRPQEIASVEIEGYSRICLADEAIPLFALDWTILL